MFFMILPWVKRLQVWHLVHYVRFRGRILYNKALLNQYKIEARDQYHTHWCVLRVKILLAYLYSIARLCIISLKEPGPSRERRLTIEPIRTNILEFFDTHNYAVDIGRFYSVQGVIQA